MHEVVKSIPMALEAREPLDPLPATALHLEYVRHGVRAPAVGGVDFDRLPAGALGAGVVAAFLAAEGEARQHDAVAAEPLLPARREALDRGAHLLAPAVPEVIEMRKAQREHVGRMLRQDLLPQRESAVKLARAPGAQGVYVQALALGRVGREAAGVRF